ncbi:MAG: sulfatase-like hydrolase/transferase [bacterium]
MDFLKENKLRGNYLFACKSVFYMAGKVLIASFLVGIFAVAKIFYNGGPGYRNILLIGGTVLTFFTMTIYGVLVAFYNDEKQDSWLKLFISFCGFFPFIFGCYLIFYESFWRAKLLLKEFSFQTILAGLFFLSVGLIIINGINKIKILQKNSDKRFYFANWSFAFILFLFAFPRLLGGISPQGNSFRLEIPFILFWYWFFCFIQRENNYKPYIAAVPILLFYLFFDLYYIAFGKIFKIIDIKEIPGLVKVLPFSYTVVGIMLIIIPSFLYILFVDYKKYKQLLAGMIIVFCLSCTVKYTPDIFLKFFNFTSKGVTEWSDKKSVEDNGRFMMILYSEAKRNLAIKQTMLFRNRDKYEKEIKALSSYLARKSIKRNIHLIVLESFLDPTLLRNVRFLKEPIYQEFSSFFHGKEGFSISPVFAGKTAQAEFEILCGIPALDVLDSVEFNLFTGGDAYGLPGILKEIGYRTIVSNAYRPDLFNAFQAYKSIGFSEIYFPVEYTPGLETYLSTGDITDEEIMFDSTLFDQNIKFISRIIQNNPGQPIFNYVIGSYGHYPFKLNRNKRPEIIEINSEIGGDELKRQVNQFYYRSEAVIKFVKELINIDPGSMIVLVSDHLPFFVDSDDYSLFGYLENIENANKYNRIYIVENGEPVKYDTIFHHDIPTLILNYITGGQYLLENHYDFGLRPIDKSKYYEKYMRFMAHAIK